MKVSPGSRETAVKDRANSQSIVADRSVLKRDGGSFRSSSLERVSLGEGLVVDVEFTWRKTEQSRVSSTRRTRELEGERRALTLEELEKLLGRVLDSIVVGLPQELDPFPLVDGFELETSLLEGFEDSVPRDDLGLEDVPYGSRGGRSGGGEGDDCERDEESQQEVRTRRERAREGKTDLR